MDVGGVYGGGAGAISHYSSHVALLHRRLFLLLKLGDIDFIFRNGGFFFHFCYLLFEIIAQILSHHLPRLLLRLLRAGLHPAVPVLQRAHFGLAHPHPLGALLGHRRDL